ncbi:MAG: SHOCT domain-containing protein [Ignavibacteriaceae bacterium]
MFHDMFMGNIWFGWFFWILIIALIFVLIWTNTREKNKYIPFDGNETALDILKKRYAKGEITKEQFDQMKKDLD